MSSICRTWVQRSSDTASKAAITIDEAAITGKERRGVLQALSTDDNAKPAMPIGMVANKMAADMRSAGDCRSRLTKASRVPCQSLRTSLAKYESTAAKAANCMMAENAEPGSVHPSKAGTMRI